MATLSELIFALVLGLVLITALAGFGAWFISKVLRARRLQAEAAGKPPPGGWGGKDHERVRTKYFEKERRARDIRARRRRQTPPKPPPDAPVPGPVNLDRLHRATLGLNGEVTPEAVREAYKTRVREYHPDQVARLGTKLQTLAEEETKRINEAYAYFRERYGF